MIVKNKGEWVGNKQKFLALEEQIEAKKYYITDLAEFAISNADMALALTTESSLYQVGDVFICNDTGTYLKGHIYKFTAEGGVYSWEDITPTGSSGWGSIPGNIEDQTDLFEAISQEWEE